MTVRWSEVTAVLGGTFDPPHLSHREAARGLFENPGVRGLLVMPSGSPPLKPGSTPARHRLRMTELCFEGLPDVRVDRREIDRAERTGKPSYTIETLLELRSELPRIAFVTGAEQIAQMELWHRFPELLSVSNWLVLERRPAGEAQAFETLRQWEASGLIRAEADEWVTPGKTRIRRVATGAPALSSSEIREEIARSTDQDKLLESLKKKLPPTVLAYLMENGLYGIRRHHD